MHSGSNGRYAGFVSQIEAQLITLSAILKTYVAKGYAVLEMPPSKAIEYLVNGNRLEWLRVRNHEVLGTDLEKLLETFPQATVLKPGAEYVAMPKNWNGANGNRGNGMVVQYSGMEFSTHDFVIGAQGVFVQNLATRRPVELTFFEFYNALDELKPTRQGKIRSKVSEEKNEVL